MIIESANFKLKLEEFQKGHTFSPSNETEEKVFWLVNRWMNRATDFNFSTSGSTGIPKKVRISREKIEYSVLSTFEAIDPKRAIKSALLCLDPGFIGGAMVVFRALIEDLDLYIIEPSSDVISALPADYQTDLVSMVPLQYEYLKPADVERFGTILVGGGALEIRPENDASSANVYATYGMTETVSHIALRKANETLYSTVGDIKTRLSEDDCLEFKGKITDDKWLKTNDIAVLHSPSTFQWVGRKDFIINSGGIKINPETIEQKLSDQIEDPFIISYLPDPKLGQKVVLVLAEDKPETLQFDVLGKYEVPKSIYEQQTIFKTASGKIDRIKTQRELVESLQ